MPYKTKGNRLVNEVTLGDGYPLSSNLKPLKVGGKTSPLEMASAYPDDSVKGKVKINGDLEVVGSTKGISVTVDAQTWTKSLGGYKTNNNSSTNYYFQYYPNYHLWTNYDSSPTSINSTDVYSAAYFPKASGTLTNIDVVCRASDTGTTDPLKFYVFKGTPANNATSTSLTQIGVTDTITPIALKQMKTSTDISSSNDFSATDRLWVMYKKDSTSANQDLYFEVTISGEYD
jgi:hypothetical protein